MFTGIIECIGSIEQINQLGSGVEFWVKSPISDQLSIDQSLSHNGVCLTVEEVAGNQHKVTAIAETLKKTNLGSWKKGGQVNIERSLQLNGRLDGHFVQGHIDGIGICLANIEKNGSWEFTIGFEQEFEGLIIEKGSISLDGISLTIFNVTENSFTVAVIPYTYQHTTIQYVSEGDILNLEFDVIGKYVKRILSAQLK